VVYLFSRCELALLQALFAERMRLDVAVTDTLPSTTVAFVGLGVSLVLVVLFVNDLLMLGAVLLTLSEPTAAGVGAGTLWFIWHGFTSLSGIRKAPQDFSREASPILSILPVYSTWL
jgi:hypothetical protein